MLQDLGEADLSWFHPDVDAYVAPHEALARFARTKGGVAASRIVTLGMPLRRHLPA